MNGKPRIAGNQGSGLVPVADTWARAARLAWGVVVASLAVLLAVVVAAVPAHAAASAGAASRAPSAGQAQLPTLDLVFLVDESGSETPQKVADEKATVGTIVQSLLNPASRVTVIGFGGVNHVAPNQVPTDVACVPTIANTAANQDYLSTCVNKLHRRTEAEGDDTDYAAALAQAMSYLSPSSTATPPSPAGAHKVIIMMTDGAVDVYRDTQQYGTNWLLGEQTAINQQLGAAKTDGVQFWPLGFGTADIGQNVDGTNITVAQAKAYLSMLAGEAAPSICGTTKNVVQPHATWVDNPDDAINAIDQLYADASCGGVNFNQQTLQPGGSVTLTVTIPQIASAAAIGVARGSSAVSVTFQPPSGAAISNSPDITGQDSAVETLHLYNISAADVGPWHITLTAPPGQASELVRATAFWQGAVRALTTVTPPSAKLGQQVKVTLDVLGPNGPITDASTLASLIVGVTATGNGVQGAADVPISPVSGSPGEWSGTYTVPSQPTTLTFSGIASGYGLYTTTVSATVGVGSQTQGLGGTVEFNGTSVQAGSDITGQVVLTNQTGSAQQVKLVATVSGPSGVTASLASPSGAFTVPAGSPPSEPFAIAVGSGSPAGTANVQVEAVNAATGQVLGTGTQDFTITKPPGFIAQYKWLIIAIILLIITALLAWFAAWRASKARRDVRHLKVLPRRGEWSGRDLEAKGKWAEVFPFIIHDETSAAPRLDHPGGGQTAGVYEVRRGKRGLVRLRTPNSPKSFDIEIGGPGLRMKNGLELSFRDTRHPEWASGAGLVSESDGWNGSDSPGGSGADSPHDWKGSRNLGGVADWSGSGITTPAAPQPDADEDRRPPTAPPPPPAPQDPWL